jgi:acyl dehydratase
MYSRNLKLSPFSFCTNADYCGGDHFYDSGDLRAIKYEYKTTVISPENPGDRIKAIFEDFDVRDDDSFVIYNTRCRCSFVI